MTYDAETKVLQCQCKEDCEVSEWIKNGENLEANGSTLEANGTGTYGCLVNEIYQEKFVQILEPPKLESNVGPTVLLDSNVTLTCTARSQATSIMWMLDEYPYNCDQDDECVIGKSSKIRFVQKCPFYVTSEVYSYLLAIFSRNCCFLKSTLFSEIQFSPNSIVF